MQEHLHLGENEPLDPPRPGRPTCLRQHIQVHLHHQITLVFCSRVKDGDTRIHRPTRRIRPKMDTRHTPWQMGTTMEQGWWVHLTKAWSTDRAMVGPTCQLYSTDIQDLLEVSGWPLTTHPCVPSLIPIDRSLATPCPYHLLGSAPFISPPTLARPLPF